jgi:hypothetical protein
MDQNLDQPGQEIAAEAGNGQVHGQTIAPGEPSHPGHHWHHQHIAELHDEPHRPIQHTREVVDQPEGVDLELVDMVAVHQLDRHHQHRERCDQSDDVARMSGQEQVESDLDLLVPLFCHHRAPPPGAIRDATRRHTATDG